MDGLDEPTSKYIYEEMQNILKEEEDKSKRFESLKAEIVKLKGKYLYCIRKLPVMTVYLSVHTRTFPTPFNVLTYIFKKLLI